MRLLLVSWLMVAAAATAQGVPAGSAADTSPHSEAALVSDAASVRPGGTVDVALRLRLDDGWHAYWRNPGDAGLPVRLRWTLPPGAAAGPLRFPPPARTTLLGLTAFTHEGEAFFFTTVRVPDDAAGTVRLAAEASWLVCTDVCLPARDSVALVLPVGSLPARSADANAVEAARTRLPQPAAGWTASAAAVAGGYALTLAPPAGVDLTGATFFPDTAGVLSHGAPQRWRREGAAWAAMLAADSAAAAPSRRLRGVLVPRTAPAVDIDAAVAGADRADGRPQTPRGGRGAGWMWLFALAGGLLLNLMPCVFPVLSLKVLGFAQGHDAPTMRRHGLAFGAGVVGSFVALAALLVALRASGAALGWGFQLQSPPVIAGLAALMLVLALGLLGVVEIGTGLASASARWDRRHGTAGAFLSGVLAVVVASPCTAPLMGAALGWALAQPAAVAVAVFAVLGVGMALPVVALSFAPKLLARLPRPGAWMETLKQALAFPLLLTVVWLVWVFGRQTSVDGVAALLMALVWVALGAWVVGRWPAARIRPRTRLLSRLFVGALVAGAALLVGVAARADDRTGAPGIATAAEAAAGGWAAFDPARVDALVAEGRPVFVNFTAAWCLTCQVNKRTTLQTGAVEAAFERAGVVRFEADWTDRDATIERALVRFGRSGVPLYVLYPGGGRAPVLLPEVLTPEVVLAALAEEG